ncbi:MAG: DNA mismatch repair protein MutS [Eubacteriales bacterium]|nr:DNA mismatch repair protein MutS [Eubacteriales bacterium]
MNADRVLEFDTIKMKWKELAVTEWGKGQIDEAACILDERELRKHLKDTDDARSLIDRCGAPPLTSIDEAKEIVVLAGKDCCLTPYQLERIGGVLTAVRRLKDYLNRGKQFENALAYYELNLDDLEELREEIAMQIRGGEVDDYASKLLLKLRGDIGRTEEKMKEKAEQVMRANKECMADSFTTRRNGRVCIPVKKDYKWKIPGSVIDRSSTGNTLFVEVVSVANLYEELQLLKIEEENEVHRILYTLTAMVADGATVMNENIRVMEKLDYMFSKGKLSLDMDAAAPKINLDRRIRMKQARHPLMSREMSVPLDFEIGGEVSGIVITGPNTGGKTVAIKTVALNCLMAQCGLHVTCQEADICMNSAFLCDIGDGQNITENLSTFSAHIKNVLEIMDEVNQDSLVIMDELGSGTDPTEGMGIAIAILEELRKSDCLFLVTTHYPEVKEYAAKTEGVVNARMEFDKNTLKPTYRMVIGEAGESCAFYIAERLGMPARMLRTAARAAYGEGAEATVNCEQTEWGKSDSGKRNASGENRASVQAGRKRGKQIRKEKKPSAAMTELSEKFHLGDSVMVLPDKKIGIVCKPVNEKGVLQVQLPGKKIWINHKRVKLQVAADRLYPEDYDFSIVFDTVENRKIRHDMERKYTDEVIEVHE